MNKLSYSTLACPDWEISKIIDAAKKNGFSAIDFRGYLGDVEITTSPAFSKKSANEIGKQIQDNGLSVSALSSGAKMASPTPDEQKKSLDLIKRYIDLAIILNAPMIRIFGGLLPPEGMTDQIIKANQKANELARSAGLFIAVETHDNFTCSDNLRATFENLGMPENYGYIWDLNHPYRFHNETARQTLTNLKPKLLGIHWKDSQMTAAGQQLTLLGEGDLPLREFHSMLQCSGYNGYYTFEYEKRWHPELPPPEIALPHAAYFLRRLFRD